MIKILGHDRVKCANGNCGERARQLRERERDREIDRALLKMSDGIGNKSGRWRKYL